MVAPLVVVPDVGIRRARRPGHRWHLDCHGTTPPLENPMAQCCVCGNDYAHSFEVLMAGQTYPFDSFECAIAKLAPTCAHCECRIIGHGVESELKFYCCEHCARQARDDATR
jgi:hypothetical protein